MISGLLMDIGMPDIDTIHLKQKNFHPASSGTIENFIRTV
jgi:hypothetical protein